jgi:hypothetical protein
MKNQSGQVTIDFLFASVLILSVTTLMMALTIALSLSEILQYVSYSAARSYFAGDETESDQMTAAEKKASSLVSKGLPFLHNAIASKWIIITGGAINPGNPRAKNYNNYADSLGVPSQGERTQFTGYQIKFQIPILGLKLPLLGPAIAPPDGQNGFSATVSSMLMREPSHSECVQYMNQIYDTLKNRNSTFGTTSSHTSLTTFSAILDNGC